MSSRQIFIDTETTGLSAAKGERVIEIAAVEAIDGQLTGNEFHVFLNPEREIGFGAQRIHGITNDMLVDKPKFVSVASYFVEFVRGAEMLMHNAPFDTSFLDSELARCGITSRLCNIGTVVCTLSLAKKRFPGTKNGLDMLIERAGLGGKRGKHSAIEDVRFLADVYFSLLSDKPAKSPVATDNVVKLRKTRKVKSAATIDAVAAPLDIKSLQVLLDAATPFVRIDGVVREDWCRDTLNKRHGPWKYRARYVVLDQDVWDRKGEVIYFVTDGKGRLRLVGESSISLKTRWRISPMHQVGSRAPMGRRALFHSSSWPEIEKGFAAGSDRPPFTLLALFRDQLERLCRVHGGSFVYAMEKPEKGTERLSFHVEGAVLAMDWSNHPLWNKQRVLRS